jgi:secreted PhoX family phosphatase
MKPHYKFVLGFIALASITSLTWLAACSSDDGEDGDDSGSGNSSSFSSPDVNDPLSALVAVRFTSVPAGFPGGSAPASLPADTNIADYVKALVAHADANYNFGTNTWAGGSVPSGFVFPLAQGNTDANRQIAGMTHDVPLKWLDPINVSGSQRWGSNCDYNAFFGDGWNSAANGWTGGPTGVLGNAPQWSGAGDAGYLWTNFEYISGSAPTTTSAPTDSHLILAKVLKASGILTNNVTSNVWTQADVDTYTEWNKRQTGGAYVRLVKDAAGAWTVDLSAAENKRFDSTSNTLTRITGYNLSTAEHGDNGDSLPTNVVPGIAGDCSGGQSPWGTIFTAEENVQDYYGDLEACWNSSQKFTTGQGFDSGASVNPPFAPSTSGEYSRHSDPNQSHQRDGYGWAVEIDPEQVPDNFYDSITTGGDGLGHRKMGAFGRFRWENVTFVTGTDGKLPNNQPIVMYGADDRRGGRIYKFISTNNYVNTMTRAEVRVLLDDGRLYVAHFTDLHNATGVTVGATVSEGGETITLTGGNAGAPTQADPGDGVFIELTVNNTTQMAPNAGAAIPASHSILNGGGALPSLTVGAALQSNTYNGIGGFATDDLVYACAFTVAAKLGVRELNRPEDLEWNPFGFAGGTAADARLYIAFTNHNSRTCCDANGVLLDPADDHAASTARNDNDGRVWVLSYGGLNPATTNTFTFWEVVASNESVSGGAGLLPSNPFDFADPDNIAIDADGGVWFGTDGYFGSSDSIGSGRSDSIYYLDTDPTHVNSFGRPFRVIAAPSNAEATGPCFTPDMKTLFYSAQHPGEQPGPASTFPQPR